MIARLYHRSRSTGNFACSLQKAAGMYGIKGQRERHGGTTREREGFLVMEGNQSDKFVHMIRYSTLEPGGNRRMHAYALGARERSIGNIADKNVTEGKALVVLRRQ